MSRHVFPLPQVLAEVDSRPEAVMCRATDYPADFQIERHSHHKHQLIHAVHGVMSVRASAGHWIVPPTRAIWMPSNMPHAIRCIGVVHMRSLFIQPSAAPHMPGTAHAMGVSPLLRELIQASEEIHAPYEADSRHGRLTGLILDELRTLPILPLHLPRPVDARVRRICDRIQRHPDDASTMADWADKLDVDVKTIQRLFAKETGMTFGQWRQQARLLKAMEYLARGDKVVDIALALGYDSPSAFATMFKRQFGQTPSQFFK
jgi:AraC-like DNA-binding protein/quercetin dioxygenase-like cupin family protein